MEGIKGVAAQIYTGGWKSFGSIMSLKSGAFTKKINPILESETSLLLDAILLNKPLILEQGFNVFDQNQYRKEIHKLSDLEIGCTYLTSKETPMVRVSQDDLILGGKIIIPIVNKNSQVPTMKGTLLPETSLLALENFTRKKLSQGMLFMNKNACKIVYSLNDLLVNEKYCSQDESITLTKLQSGNIQFIFEPPEVTPIESESESNKSNGSNSLQMFTKKAISVAVLSTDKLRENALKWEWKTIPSESNVQNNVDENESKENLPENIVDNVMKTYLKGKEEMGQKLKEGKLKMVNSVKKMASKKNLFVGNAATKVTSQSSTDTTFTFDNSFDSGITDSPLVSKELINLTSPNTQPQESTPKYPLSPELDKRDGNSLSSCLSPFEPRKLMNDDLLSLTPSTPTSPRLTDFTSPLESALIPIPPPIPVIAPAPPPLPIFLKKKAVNTTSSPSQKKMVNLHWSVIPKNKLKQTFWGSISPVKFTSVNEAELEQLFSLSPSKKTVETNVAKMGTSRASINLLDLRRANNVAILLSQFKLSFTDIKSAILRLDQDHLSVEQLIALSSIFPITDDEKKVLGEFKGDISLLAPSERFFIEVLDVSFLEKRVDSLLFKCQFYSNVSEIKSIIDIIQQACSEVRNNSKFAQVLKFILALGSVLNRGTYLSSQGFKLDSLLKLGETKAKNKQYTLLHYLAHTMNQERPDLMNFYQDFQNVHKASLVSIDNANDLINDLKERLDNLGGLLESFKKENQQDVFVEKMTPFYNEAVLILQDISQSMNATLESFSSLAIYFGEDPSLSTKEFFQIICKFGPSFQRAHQENIARKAKSTNNNTQKASIVNHS